MRSGFEASSNSLPNLDRIWSEFGLRIFAVRHSIGRETGGLLQRSLARRRRASSAYSISARQQRETTMKMRILFGAIAACFALMLTASPASAQATRTWVSGVGDDANPCSRT